MIEWTEDAEKAFQRYVSLMKRTVEAMDADPSEVAEDLRRHIEEELGKGNSTIITEGDVREVVKRMGVLDEELILDMVSEDYGERKKPPRRSYWYGVASFLVIGLGVVLPIVTLMVEIMHHMSGEVYVDPIPTLWHVLLILIVPLANLMVWGMVVAPLTGISPKALGWLNGIAIGIAFFYTLVFIPWVPIGVLGIPMMGYGLLPLAPLLSFLMAIWLRRWMSSFLRQSVGCKLPGLWGGACVGFAMALPATLTRVGLKMAASDQPETQRRGLAFLEHFGSESVMVASCYQRAGFGGMMDPMGGLWTGMRPASPQQVREIVFRVTGKPFNAFPRPDHLFKGEGIFQEFDSDPDRGEFFTGALARGVSLLTSRMDGSIAPNAVLGYLEWTLEFKNDASWQQEARGQIFLPPGGVVSRLTLWVNGEEREAAFGSRAKTRHAYQQVVQRRRDPVLVTTSGKDRVAFQCFPVPPNGGVMKIRLGMTFPLILKDNTNALLKLPYFSERNFRITEDFQHSVWVESKQPIQNSSESFMAENPKPDLYALRGSLPNSDLNSREGVLCAVRNPEVLSAWAPDMIANDGSRIQQTIKKGSVPVPGRVVLVLDGSVSMQPWAQPVAEALAAFPPEIELTMIHAGRDKVEVFEPNPVQGEQARNLISTKLPSLSFKGGCDNTEALDQAWDSASGKSDSVILWIHGPQPVLLGNPEILIQKWERRPDGPKLLSLQVIPGPDKLMEKLDGLSQVSTVVPLEGACEDLKRLFKQWSGEVEMLQFHREKITSGTNEETGLGQETSMHLVRLWAKDQIEGLRSKASPEGASQEVSMASAYKLVTPLMGAVVLETEQQYQVSGLKVPDAQGIPTIPEPETWMLIIVVMALLVWASAQQRRNRWVQS